MKGDLNQSAKDALFLTEILTDLYKNGWQGGSGKAAGMLKDWKTELEESINYPKTKQRKVHATHCGKENW